ncbi:microsomal glutathione S-transferase 2-like isoform X2 [Dreissena polymorpha]|uniref:Microsomal glutathione S-transferase 2 n=1 Tax=Dreissena polymorpha TaxID=45954 RepID=A0A9D4KLN1_DREPO|nr:microsomal glutathione S-transferase 2-like isoform X2 [Dreissena polymorpha]KAH3841840.1 hypothetical protein DPMN_115321 [Dreissena polymorpha]
MSSLELKDFVWVGVIAVGHAFQLGHAATEVAVLRRKYKINPPTMDGPPDFLRAVRAQQNCLEFSVPFEIVLWTSAAFCHQAPTAMLGMVYLYARQRYIKGYIEAAEKRVPPFWLSIRALQGLSVLSITGLINVVLREYAGVNLVAMARERIF